MTADHRVEIKLACNCVQDVADAFDKAFCQYFQALRPERNRMLHCSKTRMGPPSFSSQLSIEVLQPCGNSLFADSRVA